MNFAQQDQDKAPGAGRLISLTPLIDVVFILLVFFMLASSFLDWRAVDLRLSGEPAPGGGQEPVMVIVLFGEGGLALDGNRLEREALLQEVSERLEEDEETAILLQPRQGVSLQRVIALMDALKARGGENVALSSGGAP